MVESCTVITTVANELLAPLHNRMPVILAPEQFALWLDPAIEDPQRLEPLLASYPAASMIAYPSHRAVNSPANDTPQCLEPAAAGKTQGSLFE